eukprot:scaffold229838_cov50-Cyclotella_meneghiniana.AAC.4
MSTTENMQRYKRLRYPDNNDANNAINNNNKNNKIRAYRLNLERPFNILNEQSPLEYGDYMKIWNEKDYPPTMGPVEYIPPRHLGGNAQVWTTLMQFSRIAQNTKTKDDVDNNDAVVTDSLQRLNLQEQEVVIDDADADHYFTNNDDTTDTSLPLPLSYSNWRILTPDEITYHRNLGEIDPRTGEYTFRTYDLHHVVEKRRCKKTLDVSTAAEESDAVFDADGDADSPTSCMELITVLSTETDGSEYDRTNTSTPQDMENMTARLFRRSELSLREKEIKIKKLQEEEERAKLEKEKRREMEERARCIAEGKKYKRSSSTASSTGSKTRGGFKSSSKKLIKSLSSLSSKLNNSGMGGGEYSRSGSGSVCQNPKLMKKSSAQASAIEKARDLIDEDDGKEEGDDVDNLDKKKPLNLYIYGEYDVLNDLVNDGAKRLSKSKHLSDIDLLLQNDPCPPPDRWVRPTGWSLCNPSSCYAANPPEGYDLNSYNTNLVKLPNKEQETAATAANNNAVNTASIKYSTISEGAKMSPKDSDGTQTTAADISGSTSEDLFDNRSSSSKVQVSVKTLPNTESTSRSSLKQSGTGTASSVKSSAGSRTKAAAASSSSGSINNNNGIKKKKKSVGKRLSGIFK